MVSLTHALALICLGEFHEFVVFLQLPIHDGLDTVHIFSSFRALKLLVAEERKLMENLAGSRSLFLALEFTNRWF